MNGHGIESILVENTYLTDQFDPVTLMEESWYATFTTASGSHFACPKSYLGGRNPEDAIVEASMDSMLAQNDYKFNPRTLNWILVGYKYGSVDYCRFNGERNLMDEEELFHSKAG